MPHQILGLHHVTATVDEAQPDLDFCTGALGLRLVKKTVNFDNHHVFHFYYGDQRGSPGSIWTTFPYHGRGVRVGTKGAGQVTATSFSVPAGSLDFWSARLAGRGMAVRARESRFGEQVIGVHDPSGLVMELVANEADARVGWDGSVAAEYAVRGLHSVSMVIQSPEQTVGLLTDLLGFKVVEDAGGRIRLGVNGGGAGKTLDIIHDRHAAAAMNGLGTVHHVALAIGSAEEQLRLREDLVARGRQVTQVLDRQYFQSIYFREPGGVLIEAATVRPGFTVDESLADLGQGLKLPPWEEPNRSVIETGLPAIVQPSR